MHPLSLFPELLIFGLVAPAILRLFVGGFLIFRGKERFLKSYKWAFVFHIISGVLVFLGLYTQAGAILGILVIAFENWSDRKIAPLSPDKNLLHSLVTLVLISLLFTGPGFLAFDLPL